MICQGPALILRAIDFQETSRIVTLYTRDLGKVAVIAKGARSAKGKFSGKLEPGMLVDVVYHHKAGRSVHTLTDIAVITPWPPQANLPERYVSRIALTDLISRILPEESPNESLFDHVSQVLSWITETNHNTVMLFPYMVVRICSWLGIAMQSGTEHPSAHRKPHFELETGLLSASADARGVVLTMSMWIYLHHAISGNRKELLELELPKADLRQMVYIMDRYISFHFEGVNPRTTEILFDSYSESLS